MRDKSVLDLGSGSGLVAIAAAQSGALSVTAHDIDPMAHVAIALNADLNGVTINTSAEDIGAIDLKSF